MNTVLFSQLQKQVLEWKQQEGLNMIDILEMVDPLRQVLNWIVRRDQVTLPQLCEYLQQDIEFIKPLVTEMANRKLLTQVDVDGAIWLRVHLTTHSHKSPASKSILDEF